MFGIRQSIRNALLSYGWDLRRTKSVADERQRERELRELEKWKFLSATRAATVLDIGANEGQFAATARHFLPHARIISFEPLQSCFATLEALKSTLSPMEALPFALGDTNGTVDIQRNDFTPSSSLLPMLDRHVQQWPQTKHSAPEQVQVRRLDDLWEGLACAAPVIAKIDVQGYSLPVLRGAVRSLAHIQQVIVEISVEPLYAGEAGFDEIHQLMNTQGFAYRGNIDQCVSRDTAEILQCDCLFVRR